MKLTKKPRAADLRLLRSMLALVGDTRLSHDKRTGAVTLIPPGQLRRDRGQLFARLPALFLAACDVLEAGGMDSDEVAGLRSFAALISQEG